MLPEVWWYVDSDTSTSDAEDSRRRYREFGFMEPELDMRKRADAFVDALYARSECARSRPAGAALKRSPPPSARTRARPPFPCHPTRRGCALSARPVIAVFGHSDFFNDVFERHLDISDCWLENAEVYRVALPPRH